MTTCIFCKIIAQDIPAQVLYEDDTTLAFLDVHPRAPGHTMVIPKTHAETILDMPDTEVGPLFQTVKKVTGTIQERLAPKGFTIGINHGKQAGQVVEHLHVHIIPRFEGDGGSNIHGVVYNPPHETLQEIAKRIRIDH